MHCRFYLFERTFNRTSRGDPDKIIRPRSWGSLLRVMVSFTYTCPIFTVRNSSCGKLMLSQACVKNSVHKGGLHPPRQTPPSRHPWIDTIPPGRHPSSHRNGHCSGQYASYWNANTFSNHRMHCTKSQLCRLKELKLKN